MKLTKFYLTKLNARLMIALGEKHSVDIEQIFIGG